MGAMTFGLFSKTHIASCLCSPTKTGSTVLKCPKLYIKLVVADCQDFYIGKTKRKLHDRKTEHFKAITSNGNRSAIAEHVTSTGHNLRWDHLF